MSVNSRTASVAVTLLHSLWRGLRWLAVGFVRTTVWLYRHWRQRPRDTEIPGPRLVFAGRWTLAGDHQCCGRPVVIHERGGYRAGVELLYFGDETALPFYAERSQDNEDDAVETAHIMHRRFPGGTRPRHPRHERMPSMPAVVTISTPHQEEAA
ncbi:TPA: hypothetical protein OME38_003953 [Klebsiella oxytoca]|nr:hypothetical protein [Klebsiella oxytoca]